MNLDHVGDSSVLDTWAEQWRSRPGYLPPDRRANFRLWSTPVIRVGDEEVGVLALGAGSSERPYGAFIADIWIAPEHRRSRYASQALQLAEQWCRVHGVRNVHTACIPTDPSQARLFSAYSTESRHMTIDVAGSDSGIPTDSAASIRAMTETEFASWKHRAARSFAAGSSGEEPPPPRALDDAHAALDQLLPEGLSTRGHELLMMHADGAPVASLWLSYNDDADEAFIYDVQVSEEHRGNGYGRMMMAAASRSAAARGLGRVRLHVFEENLPAIGLYRKLGYRTTVEFRVKDL